MPIEASCRKDFTSTMFVAPLRFREGARELTLAGVAQRCAGKRVLILVHGYHTDYVNGYDAYCAIAMMLADAGVEYDEVIFFFWPGSWAYLGFFPSQARADRAGRELGNLLAALTDAGATVDLETHSLGARVALEALMQRVARHLILTAPAVDDECLQIGERYFNAATNCRRVVVMHSKRDSVLKWSYTLATWDKALGLDGPEHPERMPSNVDVIDFKKEIGGHGEYKRCERVYKLWPRE